MADGVAITAGSGTTILTDDTGAGGHAQVVKLAISADGSGTPIPADATNGIDVDPTRHPPVITGSGSHTGTTSTTLTLNGEANTAFQLTGTWSATVVFEASIDNSNWSTIYAYKAGDAQITQAVTNSTGNDIYRCTTSGFGYVRARVSAYTSGTVVITAVASARTSGVFLNFPLPPSAGLAVAHGANPTAVAAGLRNDLLSNRAGVPFHIGGHPNIVTYGMSITTAVTNAIIGPTVGLGAKFVATGLTVTADNANTVFPSVVIGFGTASAPAFAGTPGTAKILGGHPGVPAGGGFSRGDGSGMLGVGADDEEVRITTVGTVTGLYVVLQGYTIES
jgi:hypothetical protein